jgi:hypothetical protein
MRRTIAFAWIGMCIGAASACGAARSGNVSPSATEDPQPLRDLSGQTLIVLPARFLTVSKELSWRDSVPQATQYLADLDAEIEFEFSERPLKAKWIFPNDLAARAKRAPGVAEDPKSLPAGELQGRKVKPEYDVSDTLASPIRALTSLTDARLVLYPVEVRLEPGFAVLRAVVMDPRFARVRWIGEVRTDSVTRFSKGIAATLASRLADLVLLR